MLKRVRDLRLNLIQRFYRFWFVLTDTQHKGTIAINSDDIGVVARRAVLPHKATIKDRLLHRIEVQCVWQRILAEPAGLFRFQTRSLLRTRQ